MPRERVAAFEDASTAAFASLAHETRLDIIRVLGTPEAPGTMPTLSFSDLRERVGEPNSSRFNYHLGELVGHYVAETDAGYRLTLPGLLVQTALRKGVYAPPDAVELDPFDAGADCTGCGERLRARYTGGGLEVACHECGAFFFRRPLAPSTVEESSREHLLDAAGRSLLQDIGLRREGLCPVCSRAVQPRIEPAEDVTDLRDTRPLDLLVVTDCEHCTIYAVNTVGEYVLSHPAVRALLREAGADPGRPWAFPFAAGDVGTTVRSRDPWRVTVTVAVPEAETVAVVDDSLSVDVQSALSPGGSSSGRAAELSEGTSSREPSDGPSFTGS